MTEALFIGLDLGGTEVKVGLGERDGTLIWNDRQPSNARGGGEAILAALGEAGDRALAEAKTLGRPVAALGLGTPGVIDAKTGKIRYPVANLGGWCGTDLPGFFQERFGLPAVIENDANAAGWGEYRAGAGRGAHTMVMTTVGTGIGGGAVIEGRLLRGANGGGMELGHTLLRSGGRACHCGLAGCVEAYAGGRSMADEWGRRAAKAGIPLDHEVGGDGPELRDLLRADRSGDTLAAEVLDDGARALGAGLVSALHLLNPDLLVLGGGILAARPRQRDLAVAAIEESILPKAWEELRVVAAECGNEAGMIGAICLAADLVDEGVNG